MARQGMRGSTVFGIVLGAALVVSFISSRRGGAEAGQVLVSSGNGVAETRDIGRFSGVSLSGIGNVTVSLGEKPSLEVRAPENVRRSLQITVEHDTLMLRTKRGARLPRGSRVSYRVVTPSLERLAVSGAGDIRAEKLEGDGVTLSSSGAGSLYVQDVQADELEADLTGAGDMQLSGKVGEQKVTVSGAGSYQACALESEDAEIDVSGAGDAFVQATDILDVTVSGASDVRYRGDAEVSSSVSGSGSVSRSESCG